MTQKLKFAIENISPLEDESLDRSQFSKLLVDAFSTSPSKHDTYVTEETLKKTADSIKLKPFVFGVDKRFDDISTHVPEEVPAGFVPSNAKIEFKTMANGHIMMSTEVLIWKRYSGNLLNYFQRDGNKKGVSVEIEILDSREDEKTGLLEIVNFVYTCITGLGDMIEPAIPNAQAILAFSKEYEEDYVMEFGKYEDLNFKIPASVKTNAKEGLELREKLGRGGTAVGLGTARYLVKNDIATPEKIRHIAKYFPRHAAIANLDDKESNGWIAWQLWGGNAGRKWSTSLVKRMNELDDTKMSYFSEEEPTRDVIDIIENSNDNPIADNYLGIDREDNTNLGGQENMAEKTIEDKNEQEEKTFNYSELFAEEKEEFAKLFAEVEDEGDEEDEKKKFAEAKEEFGSGKNPSALMAGMYAAMKKMSAKMSAMKEKMAKADEDKEVYMAQKAENEELKKRFAELENEKKEFEVSSFLKEMSEKKVISEDSFSEMKEKAKEFSFAEIDGWKNHCKAFSFDFEDVKSENEDTTGIVKYAIDYAGVKVTQSDDIWAGLNK